jgi:hypothetical protein
MVMRAPLPEFALPWPRFGIPSIALFPGRAPAQGRTLDAAALAICRFQKQAPGVRSESSLTCADGKTPARTTPISAANASSPLIHYIRTSRLICKIFGAVLTRHAFPYCPPGSLSEKNGYLNDFQQGIRQEGGKAAGE